MKKLIHLRGTNGVGKTTAVLQFIERGKFTEETVAYKGKDLPYHYEARRNIVVLGRYGHRTCGGIDGVITDKEYLKNAIAYILRSIRPAVLVFEGVLYGVTYKLAEEIRKICGLTGYEYIGLCLTLPLSTAVDRVIQRSGNVGLNVESVQNKYFTALSAYKRLRDAGARVELIDTGGIEYGKMYTIIEDRL